MIDGSTQTAIVNTRQAARAFSNLPVEKFLLAVDEGDNEYIIEAIVRRKLHGEKDNEWCYALKIKKIDSGCIKR